MKSINENVTLWLEVGVESKNNLRFININETCEKIRYNIALAMPTFHAFFGCDYLAAFSRKGKVRPFNLLRSDTEAQEAFSALGEGMEEVPDDIQEDIVKFTCKVYGKKKLISINEVRLQIFSCRYKPNQGRRHDFKSVCGGGG